VRDYWRGEATPAELAPRLCGSPDAFNHRGRQPWASVNFITAHDGFTLRDLVTYNEKHNEYNGEDNRDGNSSNRSWNHGVEGETDDAQVNGLRERQMKNLLATLLLSQGTPMLVAGDEFARTQHGNNNAYCQDDEISWAHWELDDRARRLVEFTRRLTALRHQFPVLRRVRWLTGAYDEELEVRDVDWIDAGGEPMRDEHWGDAASRCFGMLLDGHARESGIRRRGELATLLIVFNSWQDVVKFTLPQSAGGSAWTLQLDTNLDHAPDATQRFEMGQVYEVTGRSLLLFQLT